MSEREINTAQVKYCNKYSWDNYVANEIIYLVISTSRHEVRFK